MAVNQRGSTPGFIYVIDKGYSSLNAGQKKQGNSDKDQKLYQSGFDTKNIVEFKEPMSLVQRSVYSQNIQNNFWNTKFFQFCKRMKVKPNLPRYEMYRPLVYKG